MAPRDVASLKPRTVVEPALRRPVQCQLCSPQKRLFIFVAAMTISSVPMRAKQWQSGVSSTIEATTEPAAGSQSTSFEEGTESRYAAVSRATSWIASPAMPLRRKRPSFADIAHGVELRSRVPMRAFGENVVSL